VEIRCRGSLEFDFDELQLTLNDHVDVIRHNVEGPSDQLNCQELRVHFNDPDAQRETKNETSIKLAPNKLVAIGFPAILRADSYGVFVRGEQLEYDFTKQRISMRDREAVVLGNEKYELTAKWLWYELREGKQLGRMEAGGPGKVTGRLGKDQQRFAATWQTELVLQPFQNSDVLSLVDAAHISIEGTGEVFADALHVYLAEQPRSDNPGKSTITADKLKAIGNVRFDSPHIAGVIQDVQIWFVQPPSAGVPLAGPATSGEVNPTLLARPAPATSSKPVQKLAVQAEQLNAEIQLGDNPRLIRLAAQGKVHCEEQAVPGAASSMSLDCDVFQVLDGSTDNPIAIVEGSPARVMAQEAQLVGNVIEIHQGSNRAFIQGAGQMTLPRPQTPQAPWFVRWQHRMRFDGQLATFDGDVVAQGVQTMQAGDQVRFKATGDSLNVTLTRFLRFTQPDDTDDVALRELHFTGQCFLQSETIDPRGTRKTAEQMEIRDLRIDQVSGVLHGDGPGWLTSVHQGQDIFKEGQFATTPKGLHFLRVDFQQELVGSLTGRKVEFLGNVRTVYGPVAGWDQVIDVTDPARFGPRDVVVTSQRLALTDMGQTRDRFDAVELEATGNALVRSQTFNASGQRISYVKSKDQLVLEGDGRNYATLSYQRTPNATPASAEARKILFWPETKQIEISDLHLIDLQNLSQFNR
jgi:lipopolysaccharide export system protein LptA